MIDCGQYPTAQETKDMQRARQAARMANESDCPATVRCMRLGILDIYEQDEDLGEFFSDAIQMLKAKSNYKNSSKLRNDPKASVLREYISNLKAKDKNIALTILAKGSYQKETLEKAS